MIEETFSRLPGKTRIVMFSAVTRALVAVFAFSIALRDGVWLYWAAGLLMSVLATFSLLSLTRRKFIAKVGAEGVTVTLTTGKEMTAKWGEIEGHTIDPARRIGTLLVRKGGAGGVTMVPVSTGLMGPEATERLLERIKERLPKIEYRVPQMGKPK